MAVLTRAGHPLAGKTVRVKLRSEDLRILKSGCDFAVVDWWQRVHGRSWMFSKDERAAILYARRIAQTTIPVDNEVVYGKVGDRGYLVHVSELGAEIA